MAQVADSRHERRAFDWESGFSCLAAAKFSGSQRGRCFVIRAHGDSVCPAAPGNDRPGSQATR